MKTKNRLSFALFVTCLSIITACAVRDYYVKPGIDFSRFRRAAVLPLTPPPEVGKDQTGGLSEGISDIIGTQLLKRGWDVVERARIKSIFEERSLELTQVPIGKNLVEIQNILNVDCFVTGAITEWRSPVKGRVRGAVGLTVKIYNARTGELVWSGSGSKNISSTFGASLSKHAQEIIKRLCEDIPSR
jgi:hypothetical protein